MKRILGFSIIELLVTISIIGILSTLGFYSYSSSKMKARDTIRKQDLSSLQLSTSLYFKQEKHYPLDTGSKYGICSSAAVAGDRQNWTELQVALNPFLSTLPTDPLAKCAGAYPYADPANAKNDYLYYVRSGNRYAYWTALENRNDPARNKTSPYNTILGYTIYTSSPATYKNVDNLYGVGCKLKNTASYWDTPCFDN
jgi:prepilin-type N-terminal cleavage/methylation domain-containing protein